MRRVFAISLAIAAVMFMAGGVMAQETQQDGNDLLLKILKERNILTDQEFQEIKGQLAQEQSEVDQKLSALDRGLADYLAKAGDSVGGNSTYVQNQGVTFTSGDGMWSIFFGGLFQFGYAYETGDFVDHSTGGFGVFDNRLDFGGTIFDPAMTFYVQVDANQSLESYYGNYYAQEFFGSDGGFWLRDAWVNYDLCADAEVKAGQFKVPFGRQHLVDQSDRAFGMLGYVPSMFRGANAGRDVGVMFHNVADFDDNADGMKLEWNAGLWNGDGGNLTSYPGDHYLMWGLRVALFPMGYMPYVEGDWNGSEDVRFGIGGSFFQDEFLAPSPNDNPVTTAWQVDGVLTVAGFFFTGEYFSVKFDDGNSDYTDTAWYLQGGYFLMPGEFELIARYGMIDYDDDDQESEWAIGGAYYFNGHEWKFIGEIGQVTYDPDNGSSEDGYFIAFVLQADW
jgi:hypothetical protein